VFSIALQFDNSSESEFDIVLCGKAWYETVKMYSKRSFTDPQDKFPALAGIENTFSLRFGKQFVSWFPKLDIYRALLWSVQKGVVARRRRSPS